MRYVVTGGAGFIGSHLAEALAQEGHTVVIVDDFSTGKQENLRWAKDLDQVTVCDGSITDLSFVRQACAGADGVFHEAAIASVPKSVADPVGSNAVNVDGTLNVLVAARDAGVRKVVLASSAANYGDNPNLPLKETEPPRPQSPYAAQKLMDEYYACLFTDLYGLETACLRYFNVYGPRQDPSSPYSGVISIFINRIGAGEPITIYGDGTQTRDFIYVGDVVRANMRVMAFEYCGILNVAGGQETSLNELAAVIMESTGNSCDITYDAPREGDIHRSLADTARLEATIGKIAACSLRDGLSETIAWSRGTAE
ncbi:NAD-dependent epimerase/dehydratase family protein [Methanogenium sp. S4BF]|uniref:NAD-dependent epimerase/dehydratase family protein n=1 Tax=Methanogenium sp. S4BF TaxID=1789226 RepID=UPI002417EBFF|nr:NAD-dependent epimerase/dehydratase family protein [Methanogenium sp. S4BF]WFN34976.1 NAD-dependent epimerase/dehydratase family protein [Methanogenium sp. S4BF]